MVAVAHTLLAPPGADTSHPHNLTNGHLSPSNAYTNGAPTPSSDSDLSEVSDHIEPTVTHPPNITVDHTSGAYVDHRSSSSEDEDALGSEDADYEMEDATMDVDDAQDAQSSSQDSRRSLKRKSMTQEEDYIKNDPELYGIRRSVSDVGVLFQTVD